VEHVVTRNEIAYFVGNAFGASWASRSRSQLLRTAYDNNAPHEVITELMALPEQFYRSLDEVCDSLPHWRRVRETRE
jgi:hypothetical protein